ncbi:hypothetical protein [Oleidesulfovibrio alaskensis]|uniref:hypothetical protein n=1 Tax=Oleidesulfovibrio alaskensis TaxID=58180 RepID=UPI000480991E|nr:hypothetical protein [Oleidesulfovibrio alaskensis]
MPKLIPVQYHTKRYPSHIKPAIAELAAHFDVKQLRPAEAYCLHTEYSAGTREFSQPALEGLATIRQSHKSGIPRLWHGPQWATEFCEYIIRLCAGHPAPTIVEIHPPFTDYCPTLEDFAAIYASFEAELSAHFSPLRIVIENRHGTRYSGGRFALSKRDDVIALSKIIDRKSLKLRLCLDVPQLFSAHFGPKPRTRQDIDKVLQPLAECRHNIASIHLWGKKPNKNGAMQAHWGTLDTWLESPELKAHFLQTLYALLDDGHTRLFVPEVNSSNEDLHAIVADLESMGFEFVK